MPTFDMLSKTYYSHCPLKKRPIKKETPLDPEPEDLSTKSHDLNHNSRLRNMKQETTETPSLSSLLYHQKLWPMPAIHSTFYPFQLYSALLPHQELIKYSPIKLSRDSSLSPPSSATFIEPVKLEKAAKINHGHVPYHQNLLPLSPTSQHLSFSSFTSQSKPRIMTSAKMLTDFKISTLLKPSKEKEAAAAAKTKVSARHQCLDCKKSYSTYSGLMKHQQFHCVDQQKKVQKTVSCDECGKVYGSTGALKMHIRTHTLPCKCHLCGKAFSRPWLLQGHIRTHTGEKPFSCNHCHRAFADRSNLRAHLQTHSDVKKYSCPTCSKTFSRMSLLTKHIESGCQITMIHMK